MAKAVEPQVTEEPLVLATLKGKQFTSKQAILDFLRASVQRYKGLGRETKQEYKVRNCPVIADAYLRMHRAISATDEKKLIAEATKNGPRDLGREIAAEQRRKFIPSQDMEKMPQEPRQRVAPVTEPEQPDAASDFDEDVELEEGAEIVDEGEGGLDFGPATEQ